MPKMIDTSKIKWPGETMAVDLEVAQVTGDQIALAQHQAAWEAQTEFGKRTALIADAEEVLAQARAALPNLPMGTPPDKIREAARAIVRAQHDLEAAELVRQYGLTPEWSDKPWDALQNAIHARTARLNRACYRSVTGTGPRLGSIPLARQRQYAATLLAALQDSLNADKSIAHQGRAKLEAAGVLTDDERVNA